MTTWFTSDPHWGHANIIRYCARPFEGLEQMHNVMRERWNAVVQPGDEVWVLGDFVFGSATWGAEILASLHGCKHLVVGNHDRYGVGTYRRMGFGNVVQRYGLEVDGLSVRLRHRPPAPDTHGLTLCGHVHDRWTWSVAQRTLNVGVDVWNFTPISAAQVAAKIREELSHE